MPASPDSLPPPHGEGYTGLVIPHCLLTMTLVEPWHLVELAQCKTVCRILVKLLVVKSALCMMCSIAKV